MVTVIKKGASKRMIEQQLKKAAKKTARKGLDSKVYCGSVKFKEDGLVLQKRWRDEW
jgi:hypothetical protein